MQYEYFSTSGFFIGSIKLGSLFLSVLSIIEIWPLLLCRKYAKHLFKDENPLGKQLVSSAGYTLTIRTDNTITCSLFPLKKKPDAELTTLLKYSSFNGKSLNCIFNADYMDADRGYSRVIRNCIFNTRETGSKVWFTTVSYYIIRVTVNYASCFVSRVTGIGKI